MVDVNRFKSMQTLASPNKVRSWSYGEVKNLKQSTIVQNQNVMDYLTKVIFGPTKDWECSCGKYKRIRYKGITL